MDCCRLPSIPHGADHVVQAMTRSLDPKCPDVGRKGITAEVGNLLCRCCFLVSSCVVLVYFFHCIVLFFFFATIFIAIEIWFVLWYCNDLLQVFLTCALYAFIDIKFICWGNQQIKEGQQLEGCKTCLHMWPMAFENAWRNTSQWRATGLKSVAVNSVHNGCFVNGCLAPSQCKAHPLTTKVSVKTV